MHKYKQPKCSNCNYNHKELYTTGANKFQNTESPLVSSNENPHTDNEQKQNITLGELKETHKDQVERKL